jgi:CRP-like cAMP-binding protein
VNAADLKAIELLVEFDDADREALADLLEEQQIMAGRRLFTEGEESDGLALILEGRIRLELRGGQVLGHLPAGSALGGISLVGFGKRGTGAFCEEACRVAWLDRLGYRRLADDYPRTACRLIEALFKMLADDVRESLEDASI